MLRCVIIPRDSDPAHLADRVVSEPILAPARPTQGFADGLALGQAVDVPVAPPVPDQVLTDRDDHPGGLDYSSPLPLVRAMRERVGAGAESFLWVSVLDPTHEELSALEEEFDLQPLLVEAAGSVHQRARIQRDGDVLFALLKSLTYVEETSDVETGQVSFFLTDAFVVTIRFGATLNQWAIRQRLANQSELMQHGPIAILYTVMDWVVDGYTYTSDEVAVDIEGIEEAVFSTARTDQSSAIYRLKRENLEVRRAVHPLLEPAAEIVDHEDGTQALGLTPDTEPLFRDIAEHLFRAAELTESNDQLLMTMLMASRSQQDLQQNEDMRKISAWVAIAAVPTMVAGIYGMNFNHMPELEWEYGYFLVLGLILLVCLSMYRAFKRSGWL